jgi:23S rRNA (cytidine1920-2'-O)/16S rRNA (cytidine1409-2'-O)-methyltransferase
MREGFDARNLTAADFANAEGGVGLPRLLVCDVSFISLALILPKVFALTAPGAQAALLVKPQFEAGPARVSKGVVRDPQVHEEVCASVTALVEKLGWRRIGLIPSPIEGGDGNKEFLLGAELG